MTLDTSRMDEPTGIKGRPCEQRPEKKDAEPVLRALTRLTAQKSEEKPCDQ